MPHPTDATPRAHSVRRPRAVAVVGRSGVGKTTLVEKIVAELTARGLRVGTMKHHGRPDEPGKDTFRHVAAGALRTALISADRLAVFSAGGSEPDPEEVLARHFADLDVVVVEGFKRGPFPKIEVARASVSREILLSRQDGLAAVAADFDPGAGVPVFGLDDAAGMASFIEELQMTDKPKRDWKIRLRIDDRKIPLNKFVQDAFAGVVTALVATLKDTPSEPSSIRLEIDRRESPENEADGQ